MKRFAQFLCLLALATLAISVRPARSQSTNSANIGSCGLLTSPGNTTGTDTINPTLLGANGVGGWGVNIPIPCTVQKMAVYITTADATTHHYDFALVCNGGSYSSCVSGQIYAHLGQTAGTGGFGSLGGSIFTLSTTSAGCPSYPCVLPVGMYILAIGSDCPSSCVVLGSDGETQPLPFYATNIATYSSGIPTSITTQTVGTPVTEATGSSIPQVIWY